MHALPGWFRHASLLPSLWLGQVSTLEYLWRLHVEDFGDSSLHDEKVRVVDVQLDGPEEVADAVVLDVRPVDQVFVLAADHNLNKFILFQQHERRF